MIKTNIKWTNYTHNFWSGCHKVSAGCKFCYMHRILDAKGVDANNVKRADDKYFYEPFWDKDGKLIFTCSMSDFFIEEADAWRDRAWLTIKNTPWHTWQILTKRPERIAECLPADWGENGYPNVWLGVTVENQATINRIDQLIQIPANIRFVSAEPLIEEVNFIIDGQNKLDYIDWIIIGAESGYEGGKHRYRMCKVEWMEKVVNDAKSTGHTKIFVKQMGSYLAKIGIGSVVGANGRAVTFHGDNYNFFPESLKIWEMPTNMAKNKAA